MKNKLMREKIKTDVARKFKKTPAGNIPADWEYCKLGKYIEEVSDRNSSLKDIPVLSVTNSQGFVVSEDYFDRQVYSKDLSSYKIVRRNQFAYNPARVNVGSISYLKKFPQGLLSPMYVVFRVGPGLLPEYLAYWLKSTRFYGLVKANTQGSVRSSLNYSALAEFPLVVPTLEIQKQVVDVLNSVDDLIDKNQDLIVQAKNTRAAVVQSIFERGLPGNHVKFKNTVLGRLPLQWEVMTIGDILTDLSYGTSAKCSYVEKGYPVLRIPNVISGSINLDDIKYALIDAKEITGCSLAEGDVLIVRTNGNPKFVGRTAMVPKLKGKYLFASYLIRVRFSKEKVLPTYAYYAFSSPATRKLLEKAIRTSAGNYNLSGHGIRSTHIAIYCSLVSHES